MHAAKHITSPLIGIVPTQMPEEHIFRVNDHYINSIVLAQGVPLIFPLTTNESVYERLLPMVDGFVLTGGQDVDPERYGISPDTAAYEKLGEITPMRDSVENLILEYAYDHDVPTLGICRGIQFINAALGGTLWQDIPSQFSDTITHCQKPPYDVPIHEVNIRANSPLYDLLKSDTIPVNS